MHYMDDYEASIKQAELEGLDAAKQFRHFIDRAVLSMQPLYACLVARGL